ncbi:MAG: VOC family protein [Caulobacteraceae bacterium]
MLSEETMVAFLGTARAEASKAFYVGQLGLTLAHEDDFALVFAGAHAQLMVRKATDAAPLPGTVVGWEVADLRAANRALAAKGVVFERNPGMAQDELGIWRPAGPDGPHGVCWFKDPDGNTLSISGPV